MNEPVRKDRSYFKLFDRLDAPGCPICGIVIEDSRAYLDSVLYERVADVPMRMELRDSFGLCNLHTWQLRDVPASSAPDLGFAIIAKDLLSRFQRLTGEPPVAERRTLKAWLGRTRSRLRTRLKRSRCPACVHAARSESIRIRQLLDLFGEADFFDKYRAVDGICLPHFLLAEETHPDHPHSTRLRELQIRKTRSLHDTLDQFIEKNDHRAREEVTPAEARVWTDAMEFLRGKRGVFDSEMHRPSPRGLNRLFKR